MQNSIIEEKSGESHKEICPLNIDYESSSSPYYKNCYRGIYYRKRYIRPCPADNGSGNEAQF